MCHSLEKHLRLMVDILVLYDNVVQGAGVGNEKLLRLDIPQLGSFIQEVKVDVPRAHH